MFAHGCSLYKVSMAFESCLFKRYMGYLEKNFEFALAWWPCLKIHLEEGMPNWDLEKNWKKPCF